jgi:hypothetical protein
MAYLTINEFNNTYCSIEILDNVRFTQLERRASLLLDAVTRDFYRHHNLEEDHEYRKQKFKQAMALQIEWMYKTGLMSDDQFDNVTESTPLKNIASEVYVMLLGTGLLSRKIGVK